MAQTQSREMEDLLFTVQNELNEAKTDKNASARQVRKDELLDSMMKLFPGVYGKLMDLCEPVHKRYVMQRIYQRKKDEFCEVKDATPRHHKVNYFSEELISQHRFQIFKSTKKDGCKIE